MKLTQKRVRLMKRARRSLGSDAHTQKDLGVSQLDSRGNASLLPVMDALDASAATVEAESFREFRGATEPLNELSVCDEGSVFGVHASLNTMFKQKSNAMLNNAVFNCENIPRMHDTMKRLYEAAEQLHGITGQSALANFLNESPQLLNNWERRGMSKGGMLNAQERLGCSAIWLNTGVGPMEAASASITQIGQKHDKSANRADKAPLFEGSPTVSQSDNPVTPPEPIRYSLDITRFRRVYVVGRANGGMPERIWTDGDNPVGATDEYSEIATSDPHAFLVPIVGDTMVPRYNPGEFALVEPATEPELEDDVLVRLTTGETMLKRLLARRGGIRLGSYAVQDVQTYRPEEISWMYYVAHPVPARKIKNRM